MVPKHRTKCRWQDNVWIVNNVSSCILPRISDQSFFFQYDPDRIWPVNMPGKMKGWPVNFPVSPDIVRWPAVISSFVLYINLYSVRFYCYFIFLQLYMFPHRELMKTFAWFTGSWCWCWRHCVLGILSSLQAVYIKTDPEAAKWLDNTCRLTLY